jgi:predicted ATPase/DNA-binding SARP family transcriptional activator/DNA-binding CsgD family transcriptional regulator
MSWTTGRAQDDQPEAAAGLTPPGSLATLVIHVLGGFRIAVDGRPVEAGAWRLRKARQLVALLALAPGYRLHREQALEALWPNLAPAAAANNLRQALHAACHALAPTGPAGAAWLSLQGEMLALGPAAAIRVDAVDFETALAAAEAGADPAVWWAALERYSGDLLVDDPYAEWAARPREHLRQRYLDGLVALAARHEERGEIAPALAALQRVVEREPAHEPACRGLMRLYAQVGRPGVALEQYRQLRAALAELAAAPEAATEQFYRTLLVAEPPPGPSRETPAGPTNNLPVAVTSFVGREREIGDVRALLAGSRLLTLTGAGGGGKTRLALEVARAVAGAYPDGVWLVELAALDDPWLVPRVVISALGLPPKLNQAPLATLVEAMRFRRWLLVLDNCEHLLTACAELAAQLLAGCPALHILATSRAPLGIAGETAWRIPSLTVPPVTGEADAGPAQVAAAETVRLFCARAAAARPGFMLTATNAGAVAEICRRLDGIPLAIELAAPWVRLLPVAEIATRLAGSLDLLTGGSRSAPPRHRTLQATLDWSYALLDVPEQILLHRLAVFAGSYTLPAAEAAGAGDGIAAAAVLPLLARLVDLSLVMAEPEGGRYRLLETVRLDALARLAARGEAEATRHRHAAYYRDLALAALPALWDPHPDRDRWFAELDRDLDNVRAAWRWADRAGEPETALWLDGALAPYFTDRGLIVEARRRLATALARPGAASARARAWASLGAGLLARAVEEYAAAATWTAAGLRLFRQLDDTRGLVHALVILGTTFSWREDYQRARPPLEEALARGRAAGDGPGMGIPLFQLGVLTLFEDDLAGGGALLEECLVALQARGDLARVSHAQFMLGFVAVAQGHLAAARGWLTESLALALARRDSWALEYLAEGFAALAAAQGQAERALRLAAAAEADRERRDNHVSIHAYRRLRERLLAPARQALDSAAQAAAWAAGRALPLDEAIAEAQAGPASPPAGAAGGGAARPGKAAHGLTAREWAVAALMARGRTNREIAAELGIGERSVEEYAARARRKLDITTRAGLAAWAAAQGLPPVTPS